MSKRKSPRRKALRIVLAVLAAVLIVAATVVVTLHFAGMGNKPAPTPTEPTHAQLVVDPNAGDKIEATPAPQEPGVAIPGWSRMTVPAGVIEVSTSMPNPEANAGNYYITFELRLKDTGEVLFTTGLIPPGQYCNAVTLSRALEPGEYPAIVRVQPYRMSDQSPTNNADMETLLIVE